jgi:serine phosphatase RsbU (regulator of sigma subunit)/anti-sigma regulatory factor (Ser/Thr protein kinase)
MTLRLQSIWQFIGRNEYKVGPPEAGEVSVPVLVEITPDDPIIAYFQRNSDVTDITTLDLNSLVLKALKANGVQLVVPLVNHGELKGLLNLAPQLGERDDSVYGRQFLEELTSYASPALRVAQLIRQQRIEAGTGEGTEQELSIARQMQQLLSPTEVPSLPGWQVAAHYQPARIIGGDFYDFLQFSDGKVGFIIGKVTDKGVPAALVMATTRNMLRAAAEQLVLPGRVLERVNNLVHADIPPNMFVTCLYLLLDPASGRLRYANAGYSLPYLRRHDDIYELRVSGMPLGLMAGRHYGEKEVILTPGESILLYSDGLVEAHNAQRETFGFPRLKKLLTTALEAKGEGLIDFLLAELTEFVGKDWEQEDDVTLIVLHRLASEPEGQLPIRALEEEDLVETTIGEPWRTLVKFSLASIPGNEREAMQRITEAVQEFSLSGAYLDRLRTAIAETVMNAIEHGNENRPELPVYIHLLASKTALRILVTDWGGGRPIPEPDEPNLEAKLAGLQSPRGWGLFLIKNLTDEVYITSNNKHHTVDLIFYLEE